MKKARKRKSSKDETKKRTPAQHKRDAIRARCSEEVGGKCQRCGTRKASKLLAQPLCFVIVCTKCLGAHAASMRIAKAAAKRLQLTLFPSGRP